ncbi:MAG: A/G-specific adenine glycosylase [Candidatus Moranbacteria bacterium]|nr:A/G-specific adenine glycosylase [Candidatus Moranbacteria bacterium]
MTIRREKIKFFEGIISDFFRKTGREELPWRKPFDGAQGKGKITAYEVWVSEIMLQQTQVVRVIAFYKNFLQRFPTVQVLAQATWEEFLPYYQGLGYYARGRNMLRTAQVVMTEFGGEFPREKKLLETLPGVGPYTASAVMSFAYGENHLAWDTNLKRVIGRFFLGGKHLVSDEAFWEERLLMDKRDMNAALMDFGSALCSARPKCQACSLRSRCQYYKEKGAREQLTINKKQKEAGINWKEARVIVFLHENHRKYFSSDAKAFQPFALPSGYTTRADIKEYFLKKYRLTLAVRPPHKKLVIAGQATLWVNAQILLGEPRFALFSKNEAKEYNRGGIKKLKDPDYAT